jgi:hypothetical protein
MQAMKQHNGNMRQAKEHFIIDNTLRSSCRRESSLSARALCSRACLPQDVELASEGRCPLETPHSA